MRRRLLLGLVPALPLALLVGACGPESANLSLDLRFPQGVIEQATAMTLYVFDAKLAKCDDATGHVDELPTGDATQQFTLGKEGCANGDTWCTTFELDKDESTKMFAVVAKKASATIAEGCTTAVINQNPLAVRIQAHRFTPPKCCGDGVLQPGEQCDSSIAASCDGSAPTRCSGVAEDDVCRCDCTAKEILLSIDDTELPSLKNGPPLTKQNLALAFGPGGVDNPTMLRAVFESTDENTLGGADIHMRFLADDLRPLTTPHPLSLQLRLPLACSNVTGPGIIREQHMPSIAVASAEMVAIVYASDEESGGQSYDVYLNPQTADGCVDTKPCTMDAECAAGCAVTKGICRHSIKLDVTKGCSEPRVARGPIGTMLVTWTRKQGVFGRIWKTDGQLLPPLGEITIANGGANARVAGSSAGFRVVYQGTGSGDADGIYMIPISTTGVVGGAVLVNSVTQGVQDQPDIAMLDDGTTLVTWHSGGDVFFQRYTAKGDPVAGDQDQPLNTAGRGAASDQQHPAATGGGGFFLVAWETPGASGASDIAARFVGGQSGFGYNSVSGQNDEFIATDAQVAGDRHGPAVALGSYAVIGWEDRAAEHSGVFARRFPAPTAD